MSKDRVDSFPGPQAIRTSTSAMGPAAQWAFCLLQLGGCAESMAHPLPPQAFKLSGVLTGGWRSIPPPCPMPSGHLPQQVTWLHWAVWTLSCGETVAHPLPHASESSDFRRCWRILHSPLSSSIEAQQLSPRKYLYSRNWQNYPSPETKLQAAE